MRAARVLHRAILYMDVIQAIDRRIVEAQVRKGRRKRIKEVLHGIARRRAHRETS